MNKPPAPGYPQVLKLDLIQVLRVAILKHFTNVAFSKYVHDLGVFEVEINGVKFDIQIREVKK